MITTRNLLRLLLRGSTTTPVTRALHVTSTNSGGGGDGPHNKLLSHVDGRLDLAAKTMPENTAGALYDN